MAYHRFSCELSAVFAEFQKFEPVTVHVIHTRWHSVRQHVGYWLWSIPCKMVITITPNKWCSIYVIWMWKVCMQVLESRRVNVQMSSHHHSHHNVPYHGMVLAWWKWQFCVKLPPIQQDECLDNGWGQVSGRVQCEWSIKFSPWLIFSNPHLG